jgi:Flagellar hook-length control protein FliK
LDVAVSITPNINVIQLLSQQASGDRANLQIAGSKSDPEWNATPGTDPSSTSQLGDAFSAALLDALGHSQPQAAQPAKFQSAPDINSKTDPAAGIPSNLSALNGLDTKQIQAPAAVSLPRTLQSVLSLVSSASPVSPAAQTLTTRANLASIRPAKSSTQSSSESQPVQLAPSYSPILPVKELSTGSPSTVAEEVSPKASSAGPLSVSTKGQPNQTVPAAAPMPSLESAAAASAPDHNLGQDSLVFEAQLRSQQATSPSQTVQVVPVDFSKPAVVPVQSQAPTVPQPVVSQPAASEAPAHPRDESSATVPANLAVQPGASNGGDKGGAFEQGARQDEKPSGHTETKGEAPAGHVIAAPADAPQSSQNNPANPHTQEVSSKADAQPIAQQSPGTQPGVKTDMNLKVQGQSGENVTVRLSERSGNVQVTVRSADPGTTTMLRHELPSIQAGLERAGLQMQSITSHHSSSSEPGHESNAQSGGQERKNQNTGSEPQEKHDKRNTSQQDQWLDLMDAKA